jgi:hypothetical protein
MLRNFLAIVVSVEAYTVAPTGLSRSSGSFLSSRAPAPRLLLDELSASPLLSNPDVLSALGDPKVLLALGNPNVLSALGIAVAATAGSAIARSSGEAIGAPYPARADGYDPEAADRFYGARLPLVVWRLATLTYLTGAFNVRLLLDYAQYKRAGSPEGEPWPNEKDRAKEALSIAVGLGPTFIKLAQALSIRTDLIPEAYALELRQLQDAVPPFDSALAKELLAQELNLPTGGLGAKFKKISAEPLAAASIGQVNASEQPSVKPSTTSEWPLTGLGCPLDCLPHQVRRSASNGL